MDNRLWWLNPVTGNATEALDAPPTNVGTIGDLPAQFMSVASIAGIAACGHSATLITRGETTTGRLFRVPIARPSRGHARVRQRPSAGRVVQAPSRARVRQVIP